MRRFVASLPGRVISHLVSGALILPSLTLFLATRAEAQLQTLPTWAVVDFANKSGKGGDAVGVQAADAISNELSKTGRYDVLPREQVRRAMEAIGMRSPFTDQTQLIRLAQDLNATEIVTGEVVDWRVRPVEGGKRADVAMRVVVKNIASGLTVNGVALTESSPVRAGDLSDELLLAEAFGTAAIRAVSEMSARQLPKATLLNTFVDSAVLNQGTRSGFEVGQQLIILRGREQVATATVIEVDPDSATIRLRTQFKGIRPGDRAQVVYTVPDISGFGPAGRGRPRVSKARTKQSNTGFFQVLLVGALLATLFSGGRAGDNRVTRNVTAEASFEDFEANPSVKISWQVDAFVKGNDQREAFQIYRSDVVGVPVLVVPGSQSQARDPVDIRAVSGFTTRPRLLVDCVELAAEPIGNAPGITAGRPYIYQVELVYSISGLDFPGGATGRCFYISDKDTTGQATPLNRPELVSPAQGAVMDTQDELNAPRFSFQSVVSTTFPITVEYVLQLSSSPQFARGQTETLGNMVTPSTATQTIAPGPFNRRIPAVRNATTVWWRIGARNIDDRPGPVRDQNGQRYIWSVPRSFQVVREDLPPPP